MTSCPTYIVYAPPYDANNGGAIFLHRLVDVLRRSGERAFLWPMAPLQRQGIRNRLRKLVRSDDFTVASEMNTPVATRGDLGQDSIVVYPEIVSGNPLRAKNVVRWLLYKPGALQGPIKYGADEMFFTASPFADDIGLTGGAQSLFLWSINSSYCDLGKHNRSGSCYMMRKGHERPIVHDLEASRRVDGLSHGELALIFNECETFYCYDDATMYSHYAAICGCLSIVIPWRYDSRKDWVRDRPIARYGIAYGFDDIEHARATRHLVYDYLKEKEQEGLETAASFIVTTKKRFGFKDRDA